MSLRRSIVGLCAALMLTSGLVASVPAPATSHDHWKPWGATRAPDQTLRRGCHKYRYHYRIDRPNWAAEIFLVNPNGRKLLHDTILVESEPRKAWRRWSTELCRPSTTYGRHKIRMKVTWNPDGDNDNTPDNVDGWVKPSYFRLTRP